MNTLLDKKWIEALPETESSRKKEYRITTMGRQAVQAEIGRLRELLQNGENITKGWNV